MTNTKLTTQEVIELISLFARNLIEECNLISANTNTSNKKFKNISIQIAGLIIFVNNNKNINKNLFKQKLEKLKKQILDGVKEYEYHINSLISKAINTISD